MLTTQQEEIWSKINQFAIDKPGDQIRYSDKLGMRQQWTPAFTQRVILEYKKFLFLCVTLPGGASPSPMIDEAWHLHLTYTKNYWDSFCQQTIGRPLHHHPSAGGNTEHERHEDWYRHTCESYQQIFDEVPPKDIWPEPDEVSSKKNLKTEWPIIPPPDLRLTLLLVIPFLILPLINISHPFALNGAHFLLFYVGLMIMSGIAMLIFIHQRKMLLQPLLTEDRLEAVNLYELAFEVYGMHRAVQTAIVDMVQQQCMETPAANHFVWQPPIAGPHSDNPLQRALTARYEHAANLSYKEIANLYQHPRSNSISRLRDAMEENRYLALLVPGVVLVVAVARMLQGINNEKPITYLIILCVLHLIFSAILYTSFNSRNLLADCISDLREQGQYETLVSRNPIAGDFLFTGLTAIAGISGMSFLYTTFYREPSGTGWGASDSYAGSSCGSSGCGSSCGGGCGGCGGD